jgi:carbonic anhydrase
MSTIDPQQILTLAHERGISHDTINTLRYAGIDFESWLKGFDNVEDSVRNTVSIIKNHPLLPKDVPVHGLVIHPDTGRLDMIVNGYK